MSLSILLLYKNTQGVNSHGLVGELLGIEDYNIKWNFVFSLNKEPVGLGALGGLAVLNTDSIQEQCAALLSMYGGVVTFLYNNQNFISGNRDTEISNKIILFFDNNQWFVKSTYVAAINLYVQSKFCTGIIVLRRRITIFARVEIVKAHELHPYLDEAHGLFCFVPSKIMLTNGMCRTKQHL